MSMTLKSALQLFVPCHIDTKCTALLQSCIVPSERNASAASSCLHPTYAPCAAGRPAGTPLASTAFDKLLLVTMMHHARHVLCNGTRMMSWRRSWRPSGQCLPRCGPPGQSSNKGGSEHQSVLMGPFCRPDIRCDDRYTIVITFWW